MKLAIFVILKQFSDWEGAYLASQLNQSSQWQVKYASNQTSVTSIGGLTVLPDYQLDQLPQEIDLLVLIGGNAWQLTDQQFVTKLQQRLQNKLPVAAICGAVDFLAKNGLLNQYQHTGNSQSLWADYPDYQNQTGYQLHQAVRDRNLVTANGTAALDFTEQVLMMIDFSAQIRQQVDFYRLGFYQYCKKYGNPF
ncbi:type 1 glutamine amidotransferase family protein [Lapidilactobacillus wuchangensis]|uniref:type 1 glutamine amidotransferase family protein n=1 Tax=Lapidilactobacillus wuchangensis TaxID=2486001 RepID=UPI000F76AC83|nr:type 1 glutamine amidotransferase family protein [Lapidilactobacillus wuchangensis]